MNFIKCKLVSEQLGYAGNTEYEACHSFKIEETELFY